MTTEQRRQIVYQLEAIVGIARLVLDTNLKQLRQEQRYSADRDPLVTSLSLVDHTLCDAEQGLKTIAKWEAQ